MKDRKEPTSLEAERSRLLGLRILHFEEPEFPAELRQIPDPPVALYLRGELPPAPRLAIVGARRATSRGRAAARQLAAHAAAAGVGIVSGLAYGIDAAAHQGCLDVAGRSAAIFASGLDLPSPSGNLSLAEAILRTRGGWLSEYPPGETALPYRFPERNRLISGMSDAVLVIEAHAASGTLWTVRHALDQGRDVLVVPGAFGSEASLGSNRLIRDGAIPIVEPGDLLAWLGRPSAPAPPAPEEPLEPDAVRILGWLADQPLDADTLARRLNCSHARLSTLLLDLELRGQLRQQGTSVTRVPPGPVRSAR